MHSKAVAAKVNKWSFLISRVCKAGVAPTPRVVAILAQVHCAAVIQYGVPFWKPTKSTMKVLDSGMARPLRKCLALPRFSQTSGVLADCGNVEHSDNFGAVCLAIRESSSSAARLSSSTEVMVGPVSISSAFGACSSVGGGAVFSRTVQAWSIPDQSITWHKSALRAAAMDRSFSMWLASDGGRQLKEVKSKPGMAAHLRLDEPKVAFLRARLRHDTALLSSNLQRRRLTESASCRYVERLLKTGST